jgi:DNA-binding response OmpR family regulator
MFRLVAGPRRICFNCRITEEAGMARIAVVDDERDIRLMLADYLGAAGHEVATAGDAVELEAVLAAEPAPDLFVLDVSLPGRDGLEIARDLRARLDPGIVMLTASGGLVDRVVGLEVGADDYLAKPFDLAELAARIAAVLRRRPPRPVAAGPRFGGFTLDLRDFCLRDAGGAAVELSPMEVDLVAAFATNPGRVLTRDELMQLAPPRDDESHDRSIDHRIARLRRKLEEDPDFPKLIKTVRGAGYVFPG